jgi:hypothetical protein
MATRNTCSISVGVQLYSGTAAAVHFNGKEQEHRSWDCSHTKGRNTQEKAKFRIILLSPAGKINPCSGISQRCVNGSATLYGWELRFLATNKNSVCLFNDTVRY